MTKKFLTLILGVFWSLSCLEALHFDDKKSLILKVSNKGLTRLSFKEDKIVDLFVYPGEYQNQLNLHKSGNLFISPGEGTFYMTLIGLSGIKQDFTITYCAQKPIHPITLEKKMDSAVPNRSKPLFEILKEFIQGNLPEGFQPIAYQETRSLKEFSSGLSLKTTGCYQNKNTLVFEGLLKNQTNKFLSLNAECFKGLFVVALTSAEMAPGEEIRAYFLPALTKERAM